METLHYLITKLVNQDTINTLNKDALQQILQLVHTETNTNLKAIADKNNLSAEVVNKAYVNVLSLLTEAAKHDCTAEKLYNELFETGIQKAHVQIISDTYKSYKNYIRGNLQVIGTSLPHIVDVKWKLEYSAKTSMTQSGNLRYSIFLTTVKDNQLNTISFTCSIQQLQEIVLKLKDAIRHLEKLSMC